MRQTIQLIPFMGSGTTAMVAVQNKRHYIGCELHEEYGELIDSRMPVEILSQRVDNPLTQALY